jgi:L-fuculose-phosphate aldolase
MNEGIEVQKSELFKAEVIAVGKRLYERGYVAANDGNISVRTGENQVLITPTGVSKGFMQAGDLILLDLEGNLLDGKRKPSSESNMHLQIYKARPDVQAVCHAHPPYATGFAVAGLSLDKMVLPEAVLVLGTVPLVAYGTPGTAELYGSISRYISAYDAFLLANHGALTVGDSLTSACHKMEILEHAAKIQFIARQLGKVTELNNRQVAELLTLREKFGVRSDIGLNPKKRKNPQKK